MGLYKQALLRKQSYGVAEEDPKGLIHDYARTYIDYYPPEDLEEFGPPRTKKELDELRQALEDFKHNIRTGHYTNRQYKGRPVQAMVYLSKYPYSRNDNGDVDEITLDEWMRRYKDASTAKQLLEAQAWPYMHAVADVSEKRSWLKRLLGMK